MSLSRPLCFQGDFVGFGVELPTLEPDDIVVLREAGANTLSLYSRHCSRLALPVFGYRKKRDCGTLG